MKRTAQDSTGGSGKRENPSQQARRGRVAAARLARAARILVCECDPAAARSAADEVRDLGYEVVALHTLADSLREATVTDFDVIVASVPTLTNEKLSLLQLLRRARPLVPLVIITSDDSLAMRTRCQPMRPYYFAVRPLAADELRDALRGAVARGTSRH
jgi:DNA-binding response OmpR family regulator